jgi:cyclopropane-fatty-acyl-phospholipid synthase
MDWLLRILIARLIRRGNLRLTRARAAFDRPLEEARHHQSVDRQVHFPRRYIPALSEVLPAVERAGLLVTDIEILRLHYAATLRAWRERFLAHCETVKKLYDLRFVRMWEFYLAASEMAFVRQNMMVFQLQLTKRQGTVPITPDYVGVEETCPHVLEGRRRLPMRLAGE